MGERMYLVLRIIAYCPDKGISAKRIVEELKTEDINMNIKAVYSTIDRINAFFYPFLKENMIVVIKNVGYTVHKMIFEDGELQFLLDSIYFHKDLNYEEKEKLTHKLLDFTPMKQRERLILTTHNRKEKAFSLLQNLTTIIKAIDNQKKIKFQYIDYMIKDDKLYEVYSQRGNQGEFYIMSPYQIVLNNNHYYLIGYNEKYKNELTTYRIDRMRSVISLNHSIDEIREEFDMNDEIDKMTNMYLSTERNKLQIKCERGLLREMASKFGKDIEVQQIEDNMCIITVNDMSISEGLIGWILMLQDRVEVILPLSLREEIKERVSRLNKMYNDML